MANALPGLSALEYPVETEQVEDIVERQRAGLLFDYKTQQFIKAGGKFIKMDHLDSIRDWIERNSRTLIDTFRSLTEYHADFGTEFEKWIGNTFDVEYVKIQFKKECKRAFEKHPEIVEITNVNVEIDNTDFTVSYKANLLDETSFIGEVTNLS